MNPWKAVQQRVTVNMVTVEKGFAFCVSPRIRALMPKFVMKRPGSALSHALNRQTVFRVKIAKLIRGRASLLRGVRQTAPADQISIAMMRPVFVSLRAYALRQVAVEPVGFVKQVAALMRVMTSKTHANRSIYVIKRVVSVNHDQAVWVAYPVKAIGSVKRKRVHAPSEVPIA